jgi:hypothetical protein
LIRVGRDFGHNWILIQELRRLDIRSMFPPKSPFRALFGAFYPHPAHQSALRAEGLRTSWHPVNVGAPPSPWPLFSRLPPHAGTSGVRLCADPPAGLLHATNRRIDKGRTGPDLDERRVYIQYVTKPGDSCSENTGGGSAARRDNPPRPPYSTGGVRTQVGSVLPWDEARFDG